MGRMIVIGIIAAAAVWVQTQNSLGPGQNIPAFELSDQFGRLRTFADIRESRGAMIVFYRSADW